MISKSTNLGLGVTFRNKVKNLTYKFATDYSLKSIIIKSNR